MKIDDLLALAGPHELSTYEWGASAVMLLNELMPDNLRLTVQQTGTEARDHVRRLNATTLTYLLTREIELVDGNVVRFTVTPSPLHTTPPTIPTPGQKKMAPAAMVLMVLMMVISLALTFSTVFVTMEKGEVPNTEALTKTLSTLTELVKEAEDADSSDQQ